MLKTSVLILFLLTVTLQDSSNGTFASSFEAYPALPLKYTVQTAHFVKTNSDPTDYRYEAIM